MNVTLKDIAKKLGISHATVSLALNNSPKVAAATLKKVQAAAKEMGYQASPYMAALMAARRRSQDLTEAPVIALITPNETPDRWKTRHHLRRFVEGCSVAASRAGIRTELFWIGEKGMTAQRMNDILYNRGIRGAVLMSHGTYGERMNHEWAELSTVTYGVRELTPDTDWVAADFYGNMERTLEVLLEQGFKRVGFAMDKPFHYEHHNRWLAAYFMEQNRKGIRVIEPWQDSEPDFEGFQRWFEVAKPEAIICVHAQTVIAWLEQMGLSVPSDISVVAIGTAERDGPISGIVEDAQTCGKLAIELLIDRIHRGDFGTYAEPYHITVKGIWNKGTTMRYRS